MPPLPEETSIAGPREAAIAHSRRAEVTGWLIICALAAACWLAIVPQAQIMRGMPGMPMAPVPLLLFLPVWIGMMVAMMFPSVAPMALGFSTFRRNRRAAGRRAAPTWIFLSGYLAVWTVVGLGAYLLSLAVPAVAMDAWGVRAASPTLGGTVLVLAGLYQWSPLKSVCLRHCRSPLAVLMHHWRDGYAGAFHLGFWHGGYCAGCCWGLMAVLLAVGMMNFAWMALCSALIFAEKILPGGPLIGRLAGAVIVLLGLATLVMPLLGKMG